MKPYFCANCGMQLGVRYQAIPALNTIVRVVQYHECSLNDDFKFPEKIFSKEFEQTEGKDEFVQKINDLVPEKTVNFPDKPVDHRSPEHVKSEETTSAPAGVAGLIDRMAPTTPANDVSDEPGDRDEE